jgi:hypothetical protein
LSLDITNATGYTVVKRIYEQSDSNVYDTSHKAVPLAVRGVGL